MIRTERLDLLPLSIEIVEAAIHDRQQLEDLVDAKVSADWPNADYAKILSAEFERLRQNPDAARWSRIAVDRKRKVLIGEIGCKGGPDATGKVEIGYGVAPAYQNEGYATEMVQSLITWLWEEELVNEVTANCLETNRPSRKVLEKAGFEAVSVRNRLVNWKLTSNMTD